MRYLFIFLILLFGAYPVSYLMYYEKYKWFEDRFPIKEYPHACNDFYYLMNDLFLTILISSFLPLLYFLKKRTIGKENKAVLVLYALVMGVTFDNICKSYEFRFLLDVTIVIFTYYYFYIRQDGKNTN